LEELPKVSGLVLAANLVKIAIWIVWFIMLVVLILAPIFGDTPGWWAIVWLVGFGVFYFLYNVVEYWLTRERR